LRPVAIGRAGIHDGFGLALRVFETHHESVLAARSPAGALVFEGAQRDALFLTNEDFVSTAVEGEARFNHEGTVLAALLHVEAANDSPTEQGPVEEPAFLVVVVLFGAEVAGIHQLAREVVVALEHRRLADVAAEIFLLAHVDRSSGQLEASAESAAGAEAGRRPST
jgi:hypothetical protein